MYDPRLNKRGFPFGGSFSENGGTFLIFGGTIQKIGGSLKNMAELRLTLVKLLAPTSP